MQSQIMKLLMDWLIFIRKKGTRRHLFTNYVRFSKFEALELYEITPFSNAIDNINRNSVALELYEITPFSNYLNYDALLFGFWISTNLHHSQTRNSAPIYQDGFRYLRIYIILKLLLLIRLLLSCFRYLRIYIILKQRCLTISVDLTF